MMLSTAGNQSFDLQDADSVLFSETSSFLLNISSFVSSTANPPWLYSTSSDEPVTFNSLQTSIVSSNKSSDNAAPTNHHHAVNIWEAGKIRIPLYSIIFFLGIIGNGLVILTILQNRRMRTVTNLFLLNLAVSDLLLGVFCIPFTLIGQLLRDFIFGEVFCKLIPFFQAVSVSVSGWTLVAISVERFYAICHPLTSRKWQTRRHARCIIFAVWMVSLCIMSPVAFLSQLKPVGNDGRRKCREVWPDENLEKTFTVFLDVILLILPLCIMGAMYGLIVKQLWKADKEPSDIQRESGVLEEPRMSLTSPNAGTDTHSLTSAGPVKNNMVTFREADLKEFRVTGPVPHAPRSTGSKRDPSNSVHLGSASTFAGSRIRRCNAENCLNTKRHVLKMLLVVVLEFFLCWTPLYVVNTMQFFAPKVLYEGLGYTAISLLQLLAQASCCCNPITYCFMSSSFRLAFLRAFGCAKGDGCNRSVGTV